MDPHQRAKDVLRCKLCETSIPPLFCDTCTCTINLCQKHQFHDVTAIKNTLERKKNVLKIDLEELEKYIYPKYQEIASSISEQKANLGKNYRQLSTSLNKRSREWHRRIYNIIKGLQFYLTLMILKQNTSQFSINMKMKLQPTFLK